MSELPLNFKLLTPNVKFRKKGLNHRIGKESTLTVKRQEDSESERLLALYLLVMGRRTLRKKENI